MADTLICPVCGEANPADSEFCRNCQSRLVPLTGPLKGEDAPIHPGELPTKKVTAELEPILPEWLREARKQARQSAQEEPTVSGGDKLTKPLPQVPDLLAGLADQKGHEEDDEAPDWLRSITGAPASKKKEEPESSSQVKWVELGHNDEPAEAPSESESPVLPWMTGAEAAPEKDELTEWFKQAAGPAPASGQKPVVHEDEAPTPVQPEQTEPTAPAPHAFESFEGMRDQGAFTADSGNDLAEPPLSSDAEVPDWIKRLDANQPDSAREVSEPALPPDVGIPDWIKKLDAEAPAAGQQPASATEASSSPAETTDVPDWLKNLDEESAASGQAETDSGEVLPDWLKPAGPSAQEPAAGPSPEEPTAVEPQPAAETAPDTGELPDWIASLKPVESQGSEPGEPAVSAFETEPPAAESSSSVAAQEPEQPSPEPASPVSAFMENPEPGSDVDAIFASMQVPDWLSEIAVNKPPSSEESLPPAAKEEEPIEPAELPSWVQAMRPVESALRDTTAGSQDTRLEERGALAGLHGVLPAIPGAAAPTSKPKSQSIKLDATEQQQAHAVLLEQILSAETAPVPMKADSIPASRRVLRWALSALLIIVLGSVVLGGTQIFPMPAEVPNETIAAVQAVEAIPAGAPVLVVFDYEPATVGEMEAAGASLMDHLLLLNHPRLALISTSPTGAALAERFVTDVLAGRNYLPGGQYADLGYLPGGLAGVFDFSQDPAAVVPLGADSNEVWSLPVMQGVTHLSDFAAIIVLTDSVETGRVWIEQTTLARGNASLLLVSSAQAGPMFLPYADSGQVKGLVTGLGGAAGAEQANGGLPGFVRRYWDAYSLGLLLAVVVMLVGGLWNFWLGIQDRRVREAG
jgi:hypothetical protein